MLLTDADKKWVWEEDCGLSRGISNKRGRLFATKTIRYRSRWNRLRFWFRGNIAVDYSPRDVAGEYAACEWAGMQLDLDDSDEPWYAIY